MLESKSIRKYVLHLYVLWSMNLLIDLIFSGLVADNSFVANKFSITVGAPISVSLLCLWMSYVVVLEEVFICFTKLLIL